MRRDLHCIVRVKGRDLARCRKAEEYDGEDRADGAQRHQAEGVLLGIGVRTDGCNTHAQRHQKRLEIEALQYVPVTKVRDIRAAMGRLAEVVQQFRVNIAGRMPQEMRAAFYSAFDEAKGGWNDGIRAIDTYIENLLP